MAVYFIISSVHRKTDCLLSQRLSRCARRLHGTHESNTFLQSSDVPSFPHLPRHTLPTALYIPRSLFHTCALSRVARVTAARFMQRGNTLCDGKTVDTSNHAN